MVPSSCTARRLPTLVFDLMDTVVVDPFFADLPRRFGARLAALKTARDPDAWPAFERGELDEATFLARLYREQHPDLPTPVELRDAIVARYSFVAGMPELLSRLRAAGEPLWALSNYPVWIAHVRRQLDLEALFEGLIISCEIGARKPELAAFARAEATIGRDPGDLVLVDDRVSNCDAACHRGWGAIHFVSVAHLQVDLITRGYL